MISRFYLKSVLLASLFYSIPQSQSAGPYEWYKATKNRYSKLSKRQKIALGVGATATLASILYFALRRNDWALYNYIVRTYLSNKNSTSLALAEKWKKMGTKNQDIANRLKAVNAQFNKLIHDDKVLDHRLHLFKQQGIKLTYGDPRIQKILEKKDILNMQILNLGTTRQELNTKSLRLKEKMEELYKKFLNIKEKLPSS